MKKVLYSTSLSIGLLLSSSVFSADIIIETRVEGQNFTKYRELSGNWISSNIPADTAKSAAPGLTPQDKMGARKATANPEITKKPANAIVASARFTPDLIEAVKHHVYITFPKSANATPVTYVIKHAAGETKKVIAQDGWAALGESQANKWLSLGEYDFAPGPDQYVEIQVYGDTGAVSPNSQGQAFADAIRFTDTPVEGAIEPHPGIAAKPVNIVAAAAGAATVESQMNPIQWNTLAEGRAKAQRENKKIFIFFHSSTGTRSSDYETKTLNNPNLKSIINAGFIPVKVNMDTENATATALEVFRAGTISIFNSSGIALEKISDTPDAVKLEEILKKLS